MNFLPRTISPFRLVPDRHGLWRMPLAACLGTTLVLAAGCPSSTSTSSPRTGRTAADVDASSPAPPRVVAEVERTHVIGPAAASEIDYRVAWQYIGPDRPYKLITAQGDSIFVLDQDNYLTRIKVADGNRLWRSQVTEPIHQIMGVTFPGDRVLVMTGGEVLVLDANTGSQLQRQQLLQFANTKPELLGPYLVYGSRNGQVVWHNAAIGHHWRGYQIAHAVRVPPVISGNLLVVVGTNGAVMVLDAANARQFWGKSLLAPVVCPPVIGEHAVYVAGTDQYLRAYEIATGRLLWHVLTESPMTDSPTLIEERLYQQIPRLGLHCFNAVPWDNPAGELIWRAPAMHGNVLFQRRADLVVWDHNAKQLSLVDAARGSVVKSIAASSAAHLIAAGESGQELYAASNDGRVVRLVPRN